jgi:hypothetical protein
MPCHSCLLFGPETIGQRSACLARELLSGVLGRDLPPHNQGSPGRAASAAGSDSASRTTRWESAIRTVDALVSNSRQPYALVVRPADAMDDVYTVDFTLEGDCTDRKESPRYPIPGRSGSPERPFRAFTKRRFASRCFRRCCSIRVGLADGESLRAVARGARRPGGALAGEAGRGRELERVDPATPFARQLRQT